ncbi:MAG: MBL fold metallo-hydrolase [Tepidanaerobacter acetatoxydans]|uniref:ComEC/Rec2 family competence protein n=1 Tax=Tepidanaerobacter TaxID=499228 RepID=UPI000AE12CDE|nr:MULTISPECIES: ComEC/Rec2 family competence protein [Tepidanaerobacter]NLU10693.1 MBL fold metallo-hydrolase [Tepidanaerobacter acetatoxydans]
MQHSNVGSKKPYHKYFIILLLGLLLLSACSIEIDTLQPADDSLLEVHFIDTGQSDSIFIKSPNGKSMLIDAGNNDDGQTIIDYIERLNVHRLDFVVGTHPHEDHIGAMDDIIEHFDIGKILMPKVTANTKTFKDVLLAVKDKGLKVTSARGGMEFSLDEGVNIDILAPNSSSYESLNNYSIVIKLTYGNTSFLFTGDAEKISEEEMLKNENYNLNADVLKVAHHGSSSSTTKEFLSAVSPRYAVICVGSDNPYGHPHKETLELLSDYGVQVYTTADNGNILITSDGQNIEIKRVK